MILRLTADPLNAHTNDFNNVNVKCVVCVLAGRSNKCTSKLHKFYDTQKIINMEKTEVSNFHIARFQLLGSNDLARGF